ncbi:lycopene epsilon cyclase, chloroplastic-like [Capsicum galapagoense]
MLDLVVISCGPIGLALAAKLAKLGFNVGLVGPDLSFTNNYGAWEDEFKELWLQACIEHFWKDTIVYLDDADPILIDHAHGRVSLHLLHEELLKNIFHHFILLKGVIHINLPMCVEVDILYLNLKVDSIVEATSIYSLIECEGNVVISCRFVTIASGAASGKFLQYELGGRRISVQTAYRVEVEVDNNPYDSSLMVFMHYRDYVRHDAQSLEAKYPTFLYAMPMTPTRVFFKDFLF